MKRFEEIGNEMKSGIRNKVILGYCPLQNSREII